MSDGSETTGGNFWFNVNTRQVEAGPQSDWSQLLGPYNSHEEAQGALAQVARNNEAWDDEDDGDDEDED